MSEYIRRRRLTLAALDLQTRVIKVIDTALKYGYESPEAFSRAFKKLHGVMPASARDKGVSLKVFPKISFHITIKGDIEMNYRIEQKEAFELFGIVLKTSTIDGQAFKDIPEFWERCIKDGSRAALLKAAGKKEDDITDAGVTYGRNQDGDMYYMMACYKRTKTVPQEYTVLNIPKQTWAVFEVDWKNDEDDKNLHDVWRRIFSEWFPSVNYELADCDYGIEMFFGDGESGYGVEVWIPVVKK